MNHTSLFARRMILSLGVILRCLHAGPPYSHTGITHASPTHRNPQRKTASPGKTLAPAATSILPSVPLPTLPDQPTLRIRMHYPLERHSGWM